MSSDTELDMQAVRAAIAIPLERALQSIATRAVDEIRDDLSVPVEYEDNGHPIRSMPGEPPRMETENLRDHVDYVIETVDGLPELTVYAVRPPEDEHADPDAAQILEFGGTTVNGVRVAPRPFMHPAANRIEGYAAAMTADALKDHE